MKLAMESGCFWGGVGRVIARTCGAAEWWIPIKKEHLLSIGSPYSGSRHSCTVICHPWSGKDQRKWLKEVNCTEWCTWQRNTCTDHLSCSTQIALDCADQNLSWVLSDGNLYEWHKNPWIWFLESDFFTWLTLWWIPSRIIFVDVKVLKRDRQSGVGSAAIGMQEESPCWWIVYAKSSLLKP